MTSPTSKSNALRSGSHWTKHDKKASKHKRWYNIQAVREHVNRKICGAPLRSRSEGLVKELEQQTGGKTLANAISIGGGYGQSEMDLILNGHVHSFDIYEASEGRVDGGRKLAEKFGISDKVTFHLVTEDGFPDVSDFELVYWKAALHHMPDVDDAVRWSRAALAKGGFFVMDEYVGPNRFQWTTKSLDLANALRAVLPDAFFLPDKAPAANPKPGFLERMQTRVGMIKPEQALSPEPVTKKQLNRPTPLSVAKVDPTESVDSQNIVAAFRKHFPDSDIKITGGAIYHLVFRGIADYVDGEDYADFVDLVLKTDDLLAETGDYHFAVAVAQV
jgi:SAM-dependent methyltransferase